MSLESFRLDTRAWLEANCPQSMRTPMPPDEVCWGGRRPTYKNPETKVWLDLMAAKGWTAPEWPTKYGGGGLSRQEHMILQEEMARLKCRSPLSSFGIWMLGPALLEFASEEQKLEHLPKITKGEIRWCQGYSEPNAGSDLASLQCKADDLGDHYMLNGSKVWTSYADYSDMMFCLVRTDFKNKHKGISFVLLDMDDPGVKAVPIQLISGNSPFCETFLTNVKVPKVNRIGEEGFGWTIAKALLQHERTMIGDLGSHQELSPLSVLAQKYTHSQDGKLSDRILRDKIAQVDMKNDAFQLTMQKFNEETEAGQPPGPAASMFKYYGTELNKEKYELMLNIIGYQSLGWEGELFSETELKTTRDWLRTKGNSIEGGTSEIQLNIISRRVLGLPDGGKR